MDPRARQFLWNIIHKSTKLGHSILLTTHSMAECEALCSRVGIMVNGTLVCIGTPQQLKSKYGQGYKLKVRPGQAEQATLLSHINEQFPTAKAEVGENNCHFSFHQINRKFIITVLYINYQRIYLYLMFLRKWKKFVPL